MTQSIVIQVGQCGNQIGHRFWDLALQELRSQSSSKDNDNDAFFKETENNTRSSERNAQHLKARALLVDMEEGVVSEIMKGPIHEIFDAKQVLTNSSGSGNNWAVGHFWYGSIHKNDILELLRRESEGCESLQSFFLLHSLGGGTGSGLGTSILEMLCDHYPKKHRYVTAIYPSACDDVVTSPYNAILAKNYLIDYGDCVFPVVNTALGDICNYIDKNTFFFEKNGTEKPFDCMNNIIANLLLNITSLSRFPGKMNIDINEILMNLVPFQRLHFVGSSLTPLSSTVSSHRFQDLFVDLFSSQHNLLDQDVKKGIFLSCALFLRGQVGLSDIQKKLKWQSTDLMLAPWMNHCWKMGVCKIPPIGYTWSGTLLWNNSRVWLPFANLKNRFLNMYKKKAHLHHFLKVDGMEKDLIDLSVSNLVNLIEEYENAGLPLPQKSRMQVLI